jgi:hypothetical protein
MTPPHSKNPARSVRTGLPAPGGAGKCFARRALVPSRDRKAVGSVGRVLSLADGARATQKPRLLLWYDGEFLLRFADQHYVLTWSGMLSPPKISPCFSTSARAATANDSKQHSLILPRCKR